MSSSASTNMPCFSLETARSQELSSARHSTWVMNKTKIYKIETVERIDTFMIAERKALRSYSDGRNKQRLKICDGEGDTNNCSLLCVPSYHLKHGNIGQTGR